MYNELTNKIKYDTCGTSVDAQKGDRHASTVEIEKKGWLYSGLAQYWCPKCKPKK